MTLPPASILLLGLKSPRPPLSPPRCTPEASTFTYIEARAAQRQCTVIFTSQDIDLKIIVGQDPVDRIAITAPKTPIK